MNFGVVLKNLMRDEGVTQADLAKSIGYTQRAISKWINCQSEPTEKAITKCANYFQVSADYLLGLEDDFGVKRFNENNSLSSYSNEERELIENFRKLNFYKKELIKNSVKAMLPMEEESKKKKEI